MPNKVTELMNTKLMKSLIFLGVAHLSFGLTGAHQRLWFARRCRSNAFFVESMGHDHTP